jgi:hypothetical protein
LDAEFRAEVRSAEARNDNLTTFIDSHAHLADPAFDPDRDAVIDRALDDGARAMICIGESLDAAARAATIAALGRGSCSRRPGCIRTTPLDLTLPATWRRLENS